MSSRSEQVSSPEDTPSSLEDTRSPRRSRPPHRLLHPDHRSDYARAGAHHASFGPHHAPTGVVQPRCGPTDVRIARNHVRNDPLLLRIAPDRTCRVSACVRIGCDRARIGTATRRAGLTTLASVPTMPARTTSGSAPVAIRSGSARITCELVASTPISSLNATASRAPTSARTTTTYAPSLPTSAPVPSTSASTPTELSPTPPTTIPKPPTIAPSLSTPASAVTTSAPRGAASGTILVFPVFDRPTLGSCGPTSAFIRQRRVARRPAIAPARTTGRSSLYGREVS